MHESSARQQLASDNYAGICPESLQSLMEANAGHEPAYGEDAWTARAATAISGFFETDCRVFFVFNGTAANALSLAAIGPSYRSVICHELAHIETDECGAPEFFSHGSKLLPAKGEHGKLTPGGIEEMFGRRNDIHFPRPGSISLTQATEAGTVYTAGELAAIGACARRLGLHLHMDGARFANAVASLGVQPCEISWEAGVDVLTLGGTKNGLAVGEAVVFFNHELARDFEYRCKQSGQLASKMRFISAPWLGLLSTGAWLANATHANRMAQRLATGVADIPGTQVMHPVQANSVFVSLPEPVIDALWEQGWRFYIFAAAGGARLMTSWDTTPETVDAFLHALRAAMERHPATACRPANGGPDS
ncbi:MAG: low specificity L-threonine aldolase [Zoogloea sp.]|nr:low specificity L-threonine aldolase [Zoogloea sp.]